LPDTAICFAWPLGVIDIDATHGLIVGIMGNDNLNQPPKQQNSIDG